jgi:hypothetical protein
VDHGGIGIFEFTVFVDGAATAELAEKYKTALVEFLQNQSLEFRAKYTNLTQSVGTELIRVRLERLQAGQGQIKHRYVVKG